MQAVWMFRLLVRYVQLLYTNIEHATLSQRKNASLVRCTCGHAVCIDVQAVCQIRAVSFHRCWTCKTNAASVQCDCDCELGMHTFSVQQWNYSNTGWLCMLNSRMHACTTASYVWCHMLVWTVCCGTVLSRKFELCTTSLTVTFAACLQSLAVSLQWCCLCLFPRVDAQDTFLNQHHAHDLQAWHCCCTHSMSVRTVCSHPAALCPIFRQHGSISDAIFHKQTWKHNTSQTRWKKHIPQTM